MRYTYQNPKTLYQGKRFNTLSIETPHPKGGMMTREVVDHPGAVVILPMLDDKTILLINNNRPAVQQTLLELPAGTLEDNEEPTACALRELEEETGYKSERLTFLLSFFSSPGFCNEKLFVFLAQSLTKTEQHLDETEEIEVKPTPLSKTIQFIKEGVIVDAKTIAALLYYSSL